MLTEMKLSSNGNLTRGLRAIAFRARVANSSTYSVINMKVCPLPDLESA